jgi:hypothetical protein
VGDKLKILMKEKLKTSLQLVVPSTPMTHVDVLIQQNLVTNPIPVNQHLGWS